MLRDMSSEPDLESRPFSPPKSGDTGVPDSDPFPPGLPLTVAQTPIALDAIALPDSPGANTGDIAEIRGRIDVETFAEAVRRLVAETPAIRVSLNHRNGVLRQEFVKLNDYVLEQHDLSGDAQPEQAAENWIEAQFRIPRPWNSFPLFHFALLKIDDGRFLFVQKFHHVLSDAIGRFQCFQRLSFIYDALVRGTEPLPCEPSALAERLAEEAAYLGSKAYQADLAYWNSRLEKLPESLVEIDRSKSARGRSGCPLRASHPISPDAFAHLKEAAASLGSTVPRLALALTYIGLSRLYDASDIVIGTPMHNRASPATKGAIDLAMTVMPFRMTVENDVPIAKLLKDIASKQMADRRRSRFPFASLGRAGNAVFDVIFNYIPAMEPISLGGAQVVYRNYSAGFYHPLAIDIRETRDGAVLTVTFDQGLVEADDGSRLARCLHFLLTNPEDRQQHTAATIPLMSEQERDHLLSELNDTCVPVASDATLASLCAAQARRLPDAIAVTCGTQSLSYAQLHAKAETLALHLAAAGVLPEIVVGVALSRSIELIVTLLAIHKAGGAYLPLDITLPADRIAYMVADAKAHLIVTTSEEAKQLSQTGAACINLDDSLLSTAPQAPARLVAARPENLAYVIYTSGSTGMPKGVAVEHRSAVNLALSLLAHTPKGDLDGILFSTSLSFDVSVDQLFMSLAGGGRLIVVDTLLSLPAAPGQHEVRIIEAAPSVFEALLQIEGYRAGTRLIRFAGEALARALVDRILAIDPNVRIENAYGPTEATVYASISKVGPDSGPPAIGRGLWNTQLYVLDRNMQPLPKGAKGELYIGGLGVARGYLNRPELTAERFVKNPFGEGRLYRTGDIVRWREDGELDYFNRADAQIKINGLRVELGEIELQLETMPEIAQAVAVIHTDDHKIKRILAFAIARDNSNRPDIGTVNSHLHKTLPKYMMPAAITWVEKFPLTQSGKLDRKALSLPQWHGSNRCYRAPSSKEEVSLARIWSQVLGIPKIGADDDFFELGGTSLQSVMIFARISRAHGFDLPASTMMRAPTIALQAALLEEIWRANDRSLLVVFREKGDGPPVFFVHGGGGGVMHVRDLMQDLKCSNPLYGLHAPAVDGAERLPRTIEKFAARYIAEIRKVQPQGPYHIIGFSAGGTIGYEMARQLQKAGEVVALLGIIETNTTRYRDSIRQARYDHLRRIASFGTSPAEAVKLILAPMRKAANRLKEKAPGELRHALGLAVPYEEREYFYMRWFRDVEASYTPGPYRGPITLFASQPRLEAYRNMWSDLAIDGLIVRHLPQSPDHSSVVLLPNSRFLAMQIDASLSEIAAGTGTQKTTLR